ncbi:hypothetical protein AJ79_00655 [Helicocarpus griseus UAMH5409]|uniref:Uncharacterized protein n=1 Tax=Helicocarpus griseus UAMH5409 TaxID=1447875 RepID=A0A2B7YAA5_9EURO|nr:hypothetical protein AJ79_00655 [Helicocarpus griseus UAMH5409]
MSVIISLLKRPVGYKSSCSLPSRSLPPQLKVPQLKNGRSLSHVSHIEPSGAPQPSLKLYHDPPRTTAATLESAHTTSQFGSSLESGDEIRRALRGESRRICNKNLAAPSGYLISALRDGGYNVQLGGPKRPKADLSYISAKAAEDMNAKEWDISARVNQPPRLSCATVVADYIRYVQPLLESEPSSKDLPSYDGLDAAILTVFNDESLGYLSARGYSAKDVMAWSWIITTSNSDQAVRRYRTFDKRVVEGDSDCARVPLFVLLFTLRRKAFSSGALRTLILQAWDTIRGPLLEKPSVTGTGNQGMRTPSFRRKRPWKPSGSQTPIMILAVRLIRHAGLQWPAAFPSIAELVTQVLGFDSFKNIPEEAYEKSIRRLTIWYNKLIHLLSRPSCINPYHSAVYQQRAQFHLLREMSKFSPPLPVNREGYRAITSVQLAQRKTMYEREWARYKTLSWPPWKEEKLGIDFERGNEGSESRAMKSLSHMKNVGYGMTSWEQAAAVYAGWDTDKTPTIQTRTFHPRKGPRVTAYSSREYLSNSINSEKHIEVWSARIRATRTLKEAWACFLSYQDHGLHPHRSIYFEMASKIIFSELQPSPEALPGDGKEAFPEPSSPKDVIYVKSDPPSLDGLIEQMFSHGITLSSGFLVLLLVHAKSLEAGIRYLSYSRLPQEQKHALTCGLQNLSATQIALADVPEDVFAAFIGLLCRFASFDRREQINLLTHVRYLFPALFSATEEGKLPVTASNGPVRAADLRPFEALALAVELMRLKKTQYRPAWNNLLLAFATGTVKASDFGVPVSMHRVIMWWEFSLVVKWMQDADVVLENKVFHYACLAFAKMMLAARQNPRGAESGLQFIQHTLRQSDGFSEGLPSYSSIDELRQQGIAFLKRQFHSVSLTEGERILSSFGLLGQSHMDDVASSLPKLREPPSPALLHAYVHSLGLVQDYEGLLEVLRWIKKNEAEIRIFCDQLLNGSNHMRKTVVAMRTFLDGDWTRTTEVSLEPFGSDNWPMDPDDSDTDESTQGKQIPTDDIVQQAYEIVENTELLSPWPTDKEVENYATDLRLTLASFSGRPRPKKQQPRNL